jgi:hypothetical protein
MPGDNSSTIGVGTAIEFPQGTPGIGITRLGGVSSTEFVLANIGSYFVNFQASVDEPGQLMIRLDGVEIADSVVGRALGTSQMVGISIITTSSPGSVIEIINPSGNSTALTMTPIAGGTHSVSAHLTILRLA